MSPRWIRETIVVLCFILGTGCAQTALAAK